MTLTDMIVSPAIQRERAKARRMGSLFRPEPKQEPIVEPTAKPIVKPASTPVRQVASSVVWITLDEAPIYFPKTPKPPQIPQIQTEPTLDSIFRLVCASYGKTKVEIKSIRRTSDLIRPRHVLMYLAKTFTSLSLPQIGRHIGGRDHTTALSGIRRITTLRQSDPQLDAELSRFERELAA